MYCYNLVKIKRNVKFIYVYYWSDNELSMVLKLYGYNKVCICFIVDLDFFG